MEHDHKPILHRDGKEPWCRGCGLNRNLKEPRAPQKAPAPQANPVATQFAFDHLPEHLIGVAEMFYLTAIVIEGTIPDNAQKQASLRFLADARESAMRAILISS